MKPSLALNLNRTAVLETLARFPVRNLRIFGSVACAQDEEGSDLDLLVDALPGATLFDLGGLQICLEELLRVRVDLLTPEELPVYMRAEILTQAIAV